MKKIDKCIIIITILTLPIVSCNYFQEKDLPNITILNPSESHKIKKVAVLHFENKTEHPEIESILRKSLAANLSTKGYTVVRLFEVDHLLEMAEIDITNIESVDLYQLGKILKSDAIFYGTITKCSKIFAALYSNVSVGAKIRMVNTMTAETIWEAEHVERTHEGGFPSLSPFGIPIEIAETALNVREKIVEDTAEHLVKKFIDGIPENPYNFSLESERISINEDGGNKTIKYVVSKGDTLYKIADKFYGNSARWEDIKNANKDLQEFDLKANQEIVVPNVPILNSLTELHLFEKDEVEKVVYKVKWGDSLYKIATKIYKNGKEWDRIYENNKNIITSSTDLVVGQVLILPLKANPDFKK